MISKCHQIQDPAAARGLQQYNKQQETTITIDNI